jgi:Lrp/AsnC family leucine-responsive transcriptional regulator
MQAHSSQRVRTRLNDKFDHRILQLLQNDGRISKLRLAEQVHLSPSAVFERIKRLQRDGYILGYQARLSHERLGMEVVAFVEIHLERMNAAVMERFETAVSQRASILECYMIAGSFDYLLKVLVPDMHAFRSLLASEIAKFPGVRDVQTYASVERSKAFPATDAVVDPTIDAIDANLLRLIQADGRCSTARLAEELGIVAAEARERLARLYRQGFIVGYAAVLNEAKLKSGLLAFAAIRTAPRAAGISKALKAAAQGTPEIIECHDVTGSFGHLLKLRIPDMRRHNELMESLVWPLSGVQEVRTYAVIDEIKRTGAIPVQFLPPAQVATSADLQPL